MNDAQYDYLESRIKTEEELKLLRQVYCDTKLLRKSTPSTVKDAYEALTGSIMAVELFDKEKV